MMLFFAPQSTSIIVLLPFAVLYSRGSFIVTSFTISVLFGS